MWIGVMLLGVCFSAAAKAQVAIWPNLVVAPCVRVEWDCHHVHVCAPYVNLNIDLRCCGCGGGPASCAETIGAPVPAFGGYHHPTRQQIATAADKLNHALAQFQTADSWRHYLALGDLALADTAHDDASQNSSTQQQPADSAQAASTLLAALRHFDAANANAQYQVITALPDFQHAHTLLANYMAQQPSASGKLSWIAPIASMRPVTSKGTPRGWAVDTARLPAGNSIPIFTEENIRPAEIAQSLPEELPPPVPQRGT
jgi:hypothetical protein